MPQIRFHVCSICGTNGPAGYLIREGELVTPVPIPSKTLALKAIAELDLELTEDNILQLKEKIEGADLPETSPLDDRAWTLVINPDG